MKGLKIVGWIVVALIVLLVIGITATIGWRPFIGPAAIALAQRYNMDSRDQGSKHRLEVLSQHEGIWGCTFVGECTKVCPKHVDPAGAIQRYKLSAALDEIKSFFLPRGA